MASMILFDPSLVPLDSIGHIFLLGPRYYHTDTSIPFLSWCMLSFIMTHCGLMSVPRSNAEASTCIRSAMPILSALIVSANTGYLSLLLRAALSILLSQY
ncbi:hypothetical protein EDB92DRAFT_1877242 [Lactarius akahatsu]|uniref:Uncharacterized protein n=1 Tax=Lactarius akahatsu TaxID=416441 RepID=A0AAD4Q8L4_9AGAM|nr:hypothetical protein EDB92DRAFT_1877242 [Lactarius akahatsu]